MDRLALIGLAIAFTASLILHAVDLVGTAHAARPGERTYLVAVSSGPALTLTRIGPSGAPAAGSVERQLACSRLLSVGETRLGLRCYRSTTEAAR